MIARDVIEAIRVHYGEGYKLVEQVANGTGIRANRWLDVIAFGIWPSRGLEIHGIEVKVSRADARREFKQPAKAEATAKHCDRFFVAAPAGVVPIDELLMHAPTWGLLEVLEDKNGRRTIRVARQAERLSAEPIDREFVAAVMRKIPEPTDAIRDDVRRQVAAENDALIEASVAARVSRQIGRLEELERRVAEFEAVSGIRIRESPYGGPTLRDVGDAVAIIAEGLGGKRYGTWRSELEAVANSTEQHARRLAEVSERLRAVLPVRSGE